MEFLFLYMIGVPVMKKTVKIMVAISIATGFGMSAFIEPTEAQITRRISNTYSQSVQNQTSVVGQFTLVNTTRDGNSIGNSIVDQTPDNEKLGLFIGAIENYTSGNGIFKQFQRDGGLKVALDSSGYPILETPFTPSNTGFDGGDLVAEFIESDQNFRGRNTIQYRLFNPKITEPFRSYTLDFLNLDGFGFFPNIALPSDFDTKKAVNSLTYILENNLLALTQPSDPDGGGLTEVILQNQIEEKVPEPSTVAASLIAGALGVGSLLKGKMKPS
jgi:hypothetical protein